LYIRFLVEFPKVLSLKQRTELSSILPGPAELEKVEDGTIVKKVITQSIPKKHKEEKSRKWYQEFRSSSEKKQDSVELPKPKSEKPETKQRKPRMKRKKTNSKPAKDEKKAKTKV